MLGNQNEHPSYHLPEVVIATIHLVTSQGTFHISSKFSDCKKLIVTSCMYVEGISAPFDITKGRPIG